MAMRTGKVIEIMQVMGKTVGGGIIAGKRIGGKWSWSKREEDEDDGRGGK